MKYFYVKEKVYIFIFLFKAPAKGADLIGKDIFDAISVYVIPKQQLSRRTMTVNVLSKKVNPGYSTRARFHKH